MDYFTFSIKHENGLIGRFVDNSRFTPSTILGDLIETTKGISCKENYQRAATTFQNYFGALEIADEAWDYFEKMCDLRKLIICDNMFSIAQFEMVRSFYDLSFSVQMADETPFIGSRTKPLKPRHFGFSKIEQVLDHKADTTRYYIYHCQAMIDVPFAILHYLLCHEYKFRSCEHCGKFFATKSLKQKYCTRKSPCKEYKHLRCDIAVDHFMKKIKKRKKSVMTSLSNHYPNAYNLFLDEYDSYHLTSGGKPMERSWQTLDMLDHITQIEYIREKWYKAEYK